jgi:hypothetical protein
LLAGSDTRRAALKPTSIALKAPIKEDAEAAAMVRVPEGCQWECDGEGEVGRVARVPRLHVASVNSATIDPPDEIFERCKRCGGAGGWLDDAEGDNERPRLADRPPGSLLKGPKPEKRKAFKRPGKVKTPQGSRPRRRLSGARAPLPLPLVRRRPGRRRRSRPHDARRQADGRARRQAERPLRAPALPGVPHGKLDRATRRRRAAFWNALGLDPLVICERLHAAAPSIGAMRGEIFKARETRK